MTQDKVPIDSKVLASKHSNKGIIISFATVLFSIIGLLLFEFIIISTSGDETLTTPFKIAYVGLSVLGLSGAIGSYKNQKNSHWGIASVLTAILSFDAVILFTSAFDTNDLLNLSLYAIWLGILLGLLVSLILAFVGLAKDKNKTCSIFSLIFVISLAAIPFLILT